MTRVCGTAGYTGPGPGDPSGVTGILAVPAFGGIDVSWGIPGLNGHAVAYYNLHRSTSSDPTTAVRLAQVGGTTHYDRAPVTGSPVERFYWVSSVSANDGVESDLVGPASATARPTIAQVIENLTGMIDAGHLAQTLKDPIGRIDPNRQEYLQKLAEQAEDDDALGVAFSQVLATSEEALAAISEEQIARAGQFEAVAEQNTAVQVALGELYASVNVKMGAVVKTDAQGNPIETGAIFAPQVDVNGVIGGFGLYNDGTTVEMGFDVDRFWVGRTSDVAGGHRGAKPFIIENDEVFINKAMIKDLTVGKLRSEDGSLAFVPATYDEYGELVTSSKLRGELIEAENLVVKEAATFSGDVRSSSYVAGSAGWQMLQSGFVEFNEAVVRGNVELESITINGELPNAGTILEAPTYSHTLTMGGSAYSGTVTKEDSVSFANVPEGSRFTYSFAGNFGADVIGRSGGADIKEFYEEAGSAQHLPNELPRDDSFYSRIDYTSWSGGWSRKGYFWTLAEYAGYSTSIGSTRFRANVSMGLKVWVDGSLEVNESHSGNIDFTLQSSWSGNNKTKGSISTQSRTESVDFNVPLSTGGNFIYPAFRSSSEVKVQGTLTVSNVSCTGNSPSSSNRRLVRAITQAAISGELSRLG